MMVSRLAIQRETLFDFSKLDSGMDGRKPDWVACGKLGVQGE